MTARTYVDVHVLQTVPPSNLNRDDAGSPKQAVYGGVRRARVSSQAWKRAARTAFGEQLSDLLGAGCELLGRHLLGERLVARTAFAEQVPAEQLATRTKKIAQLLAERLVARTGLDTDASARIAVHLLEPLKISAGKKKTTETAYLLFFGRAQLEQLVDLIADRAAELAGLGDKDLAAAVKDLPVQATLASGHPIDVALFGRMVADIPGLNVDAATQVAHALSTHPVEVEFDYFTAVDDENPKEDTGAGMIGTVEFNSATLYRFATVGVHQLLENLGGDVEATATALEVFLMSFVRSMPTGHENSFAHRTVPSLVAVAVREDQPVNLVSAFESPVRAGQREDGGGFAEVSAMRLAEEMCRANELWGLTPLQVTATYQRPINGDGAVLVKALGEPVPFAETVSAVVALVHGRLTGGPS
jgi:CRISPR system Cascade subunit CasC